MDFFFWGKPPGKIIFPDPYFFRRDLAPPGTRMSPKCLESGASDLPSTMYWAGAGTPGDPRGLGPPQKYEFFPGGVSRDFPGAKM